MTTPRKFTWKNPAPNVWYVVSRGKKNPNNLTREDELKSKKHWTDHHEMQYHLAMARLHKGASGGEGETTTSA